MPRHSLRSVPVAAIVAALSLVATPVPAQISPGPLSRPHASLDDRARCFDCHGARGEEDALTGRCLDCHLEIRIRRAEGRGFHARDAAGDCAACHPEHGGRDFELIEWPGGARAGFDHDRTGWPLEGRHRLAACDACHAPDRVREPPATRDGPRDPARTHLGLDPSCGGCHADPHRGRLGAGCADCHGLTAWRPARHFDHARTAFPLDGKHVDVACASCHPTPTATDPATAARTWAPIPHDDCTPCHRDVHAGRLGGTCASCHVTGGFGIVATEEFDHARTAWPLTGRHGGVECRRCHDPIEAWGPRPAHGRCLDCHTDVHAGTATLRGAPADCSSCHDSGGFVPATYDVADHDGALYTLTGRHRTVACGRCHRPATAAAARAGLDRAGVVLRPAFARCTDCHDDAHGGQLVARADGGECAACHTVDGWRPSTFGIAEHAVTALPLAGRHAETPCRDCHAADRPGLAAAVTGRAPVALTTLDAACASCHTDPHGGFGRSATELAHGGPWDCASCHGSRAFRPSRVDAELHARFAYPLRGAHRVVPCVACHEELGARRSDPTATGLPPILFDAAHGSCADCHASPHVGTMSPANERAPCDRCHDLDAFRPATGFDHERDADFSLGGAHRSVPCASCHATGPGEDGRAVVHYRATPTRCRDCHVTPAAGEPAHARRTLAR